MMSSYVVLEISQAAHDEIKERIQRVNQHGGYNHMLGKDGSEIFIGGIALVIEKEECNTCEIDSRLYRTQCTNCPKKGGG